MSERNLTLSSRKEETREPRTILPPKHFSLQEITEHFNDSLKGIKGQYQVADALLKKNNQEGCKIIWRSMIVLSESLLDYYIHEISKYCMFQMFIGQWEKTEKYKTVMVPMGIIEEAVETNNSKEWFFEYLNYRFSREVFLSAETMKDQLNMIGIGWGPMLSEAFPQNSEQQSIEFGKIVIQELFQRRNDIAHQNDRSHATSEQADITKEYVEEYIGKIEKIVNAIGKIATSKLEFDQNVARDKK